MMLILLARTSRTFETALNASGLADRESYRMRMENAIFLQIIAGAQRERHGANGYMLRAIALISLAVAPVLVWLLGQLMFLPYHSEPITWWHRLLIVVDIGLIWTLWPSYRYEGGERMLPRLRPWSSLAVRVIASAAVLTFSIFVATFPYERMHGNLLQAALPPAVGVILFGGPERSRIDSADEEHEEEIASAFKGGLFANRLLLPNEDLVDDEKLK